MMTEIDRIRAALQFIPVGGNPERWRVGAMIYSELGETGRDLWDEWRGDRGNDDAASTWRSASKDGALKIGTLFHEAKENGWRDDSNHQTPPPEELEKRRQAAVDRENREKLAVARERADTAKMAKAIWDAASKVSADHPYLSRKRVSPVASLREIEAGAAAEILGYAPKSSGELLTGRLLVVPVKQGDGLSTLELIDGEKRKAALVGRGSKTGGYWATERLPDGDGAGMTFLIGEGVATMLSAKEATGHPAIAALSSGNLLVVAKAVHERYPVAALVILADLVKVSGIPDLHAIKAARSVGGMLATPDFGSDRDPDMTDFNDMALVSGLETVARVIESAKAPALNEFLQDLDGLPVGDSDGNCWPEPLPMAAKIEPEPYPVDVLPNAIRSAVEEVACFVKAPMALVASSALAALSLACQAHIDVKRAEKLNGPVGLFMLTIADSGERKSTCDGFFTRVIRDYEEAQAEAAKSTLKDYKAASEAWESKRAGLKDKIRQLAKDNKPTASIDAALADLEHAKPEQPRVPRMLYADATPEALAYGLAKQWPSGGVVSAEAGTVFGSHGMGKDSVMRNLSLLNQLWDGASLTIDRRSNESFTVRGARLTVALQVQEPTLREFFTRSGALARGTGFLARFLVAWPVSTQGQRTFTEPPADWPHLATFNQRIVAILDRPVPIDDEGALSPYMLPFTPEAKAAWVDYHDAIERELSRGGEFNDVKDIASKSADNAARLAALFQMFEGGGGPISLEAFESASFIAAWYLHESRRFFGELSFPTELADAARLDEWLTMHCQREQTNHISTRDAQRLSPLRDLEKLAAGLRELEALDRVRVVQVGRRKIIKVNPLLVGSSE